MKRISILGSTGSIGQNALKVIDALPGTFEIVYLSAGKNARKLIEQAKKYRPKVVSISDESKYSLVKDELKGVGIEVLVGMDGLLEIAKRNDVDLVINSIVGTAGLLPTYYCINEGIDLALSNKESLVMAGELIMKLKEERNVDIIPIDSEHSAIWQCIVGERLSSVKRVILTGSGGPFRTKPIEEFQFITPEEALKHPVWEMGKKITIDSATMMNKGLEVIEAKWLFNLMLDMIDIVIHPQSIIHSLVEFNDGSVKAQLGYPDMKLPIRYAICYPERLSSCDKRLNLMEVGELTFEKPDLEKFPSIRLAYEALNRGGTAPAVLSAVNEQAVYAFLDGKIKFTDIAMLTEKGLSQIEIVDNPSLSDILEVETFATEFVKMESSKGRKGV